MRQWVPMMMIVTLFGGLGISHLPAWRSGTEALANDLQVKFDAFPTTVGSWQSEPMPIAKKVLDQAKAKAHLSRLYRTPKSSNEWNVLILVGSPGDMGAHNPEICYAGLGYKRAAKTEKLAIPGEPGSMLWQTIFEKDDLGAIPLQVIWGHGVSGRWLAADSPRLDFADRSLIFKCYVSRYLPKNASRERTDDDLPTFLEALFQEFRKSFSQQ